MIHDSWIPLKAVIPILLLLTLASGWFLHENTRKHILENKAVELKQQLSLRENIINRELEESRLKVRFLYSTPPVQGIVRASQNNGVDPYDGTQLSQWKVRLETIFKAFLENNPSVSQARYIGLADNGMELVRIDRQTGGINATHPANLQRKGNRDYFKAISQIPPGQSFVSEINLNREYGKIVVPYQPTYRVGMPVYDAHHQLFGMVVLNIDAKKVIREMLDDLPSPMQLILLNPKDGFITHPNASLAFQQELGTKASWQDYYENLPESEPGLERLQETESGIEYYSKNTFIPITNVDSGRFMRLVLLLPSEAVKEELFRQSTQLLLLAGGVLLLVIVFLLIYQANITKATRLSEAQAQFEAIIEGSSDAIISVSPSGHVTSWNTAAQDILGYSSRQAIGQLFENLLVIEDKKEEVAAALKQVAMGKYQEPIRLLLTKRNQTQIHVSMALSPIMLDAHQVMGVAAIVRDISSQVAAEDEIKNINASLEKQIQERIHELEEARNEALSASRTKSNFIANVSHEIRTPLNGIIGMHNMLRKAQTEEQRNHYLNMAETSAQALASLINDVLDLSKIEAGKLEFDNSPYDVMQVMSEIMLSMSLRAQEKGIDLILDTLDIDIPGLIGDAARLRQIMTNLLGNAIKFTHSGHIGVNVATKARHDNAVELTIQVKDTGVGIAMDKLDSIFEAFSQEDSSVTRRFGGTGLGLSITQQLCKLMGGDIKVESSKGVGSTFTCTIRQQKMEEQPNYFSNIDLSGKCFQVLAPSKPLAYNIADQLEAWHATQVETATSNPGMSSPLKLEQQKPDLMIVDESLAEPLQTQNRITPIGIIMTHTDGNTTANCQQDNVFHLTKPITPFKLARLLQQAGLIEHFSMDSIAGNTTPGLSSDLLNTGITTASLDLKDCRILIVDDNAINQQVAIGLIEDFGSDIDTAENGRDAINALRSKQYDLVLMDCQMPVMDGYTATEEIRCGAAGETAKHIPIVAMTASAMAGDRDRCLLAGMDDYITKPLNPEELFPKLAYWLKQDGDMPSEGKRDDSPVLALSRLPIWDQEALFKRVRRKEERMQEMLRIFSEITPGKVRQLQSAIQSGEKQQVQELAHSIKGSAGNIGAIRLQELCQLIETEVKVESGSQTSNQPSNQKALEQFGRGIQQELRMLMEEFSKHQNAINSL